MLPGPPIRSYRDLDVWRLARRLVREIYEATAGFPPSEARSLTDQLRRAAVSVAANIAEGHGRRLATFHYHVGVARGSANEIDSHLQLAADVGYLDAALHRRLGSRVARLARMLTALDHALTARRARGRP